MKPNYAAESRLQQKVMLPKNSPLRLTHAKGCRVYCVAGTVLITAYNEAQDFELRAGGIFTVPNNGLTLIEGIGCAYVEVELPHSQPRKPYQLLQLGKLAQLPRKLAILRTRGAHAQLKHFQH